MKRKTHGSVKRNPPSPSLKRLIRENSGLRDRLGEAEETLRAIREGEVDAVIVSGAKGDRVFSLVETENLYRLMVETMNEAGVAVSPDGTLVFCNDRASALLQYPKEQLLGHALSEFVAENDKDRFNRLLQAALTQNVNEQFSFRLKGGAPLPMHLWASHLDRPDGPMICLIGTDLSKLEAQKELIALLQKQQDELQDSRIATLSLIEDAVEAKNRAEEAGRALRESEERFKVIAEATPVGVGVVSVPDGRFLYVNSAYERKYGYAAGELLGRTTPDLYDDLRDRERFLQILKEKGSVTDLEARFKRKDGTSFWGMASVRPITFSGEKALLGTLVDITDRKKAEGALRETNAELAYFNEAMVGRELRMIDLKKEINELCKKAGEPPRYPVD